MVLPPHSRTLPRKGGWLMMHANRRWCIGTVATPEELARMLTDQTWTLCSGFRIAGHERYLFLNDATHEDGAGEWGIVKVDGSEQVQIESITFSWCQFPQAL